MTDEELLTRLDEARSMQTKMYALELLCRTLLERVTDLEAKRGPGRPRTVEVKVAETPHV